MEDYVMKSLTEYPEDKIAENCDVFHHEAVCFRLPGHSPNKCRMIKITSFNTQSIIPVPMIISFGPLGTCREVREGICSQAQHLPSKTFSATTRSMSQSTYKAALKYMWLR
jgi:hypothetical protein